jgi:hypothetical protein
MARTANLFATVSLSWLDRKGNDRDCDIEVDYTFDGETLKITKAIAFDVDPDNIPDFDEALWDAVMEQADEAYAEDQAEYGEWLSDQAEDRRAA